ncbi:ArsR/SmtB family transcription factor [Streptomyces beihaiensis]|uniref:Winged helix-turn-helix domain-containing protein n=1 Tax=Streptomyces beihaiensis TaxID=2984495 RepID=A0ABT3TYX2_9ACTN|nr:DUF5937 family protein [Streptomyces beihaiensis]MCX3061183.1 winged helix-turn-helix domain-containing protein [Streptomyces beihaiensis]
MGGLLRIHFTERDLARVHIADRPDPLWELVLAIQQLTEPRPCRHSGPVYRVWTRTARTVLHEQGLVPAARLLGRIAPGALYFPDFLTPAAAGRGLSEGLEAVRATPREQISRQLRLTHQLRPLPSWAHSLADADPARRTELVELLRALHDAVIAPDWTGVDRLFELDRARRARALCADGVDALLASLRPALRWAPPVLSAPYPADKDLRLDGRGLRLVPSFFCWATPVTTADPGLPPVVVYPVDHAPVLEHSARDTAEEALAGLLGQTRARVLGALTDGATTGELAGRLGVSAASASTHVATLRGARLAASTRAGAHVLHTLTPLGRALLEGAAPGTG